MVAPAYASENLMRFGSAFWSRDLFPIAGMPIATLFIVLNLTIVSSGRDPNIVVRLIRIAAGTSRVFGFVLRCRRHLGCSE